VTDSGSPSLDRQLRAAPARPGCYLFRDSAGTVLYVGKARELRARVQVYRKPGADGRERLADLLDHAVSVEFFVTETEAEAVLLEDRLVKLHRPARNVLLKDDKAFLFLHLDTRHAFPRLGLARRRSGPGEFFGPHASAGAARRAKRLIQKAFGLRDCSDHTLRNRARPCLKHPLGLCTAPCVGMIGVGEYERALEQAREVLQGHVRAPLREARRRMEEASARLEYETALRERNRARALEALAAPQRVRLDRTRDFDVLGLDVRGQFALLEYREGDWISTRTGRIPLAEGRLRALGELVPALYRDREEIPPEILLPELPEEAAAIEGAFSTRAGRRVRLTVPRRGERRALLRLAEANARAQRGEAATAPWPAVAARLAELIPYGAPSVVDCIDVSHLQGSDRVASKVRFVEGRPDRGQYRRFLVGGGVGNDDFGAMREVVGRVLARADEEGVADLLVLDGGALQLQAGLRAASECGIEAPLAALAKARRGRGPVAAEERLFIPDRKEPIVLERGSPERLFLQRIRDEAHRFAITYHRRRRENVRLILEEVPGIGPRKRARLLDAFGGDLRRLRDADPAELAALPGMNAGLAARVQRHLHRVLP